MRERERERESHEAYHYKKRPSKPIQTDRSTNPKKFQREKERDLKRKDMVFVLMCTSMTPTTPTTRGQAPQSSHPFELQVFIISLCVKDLKLLQWKPVPKV